MRLGERGERVEKSGRKLNCICILVRKLYNIHIYLYYMAREIGRERRETSETGREWKEDEIN